MSRHTSARMLAVTFLFAAATFCAAGDWPNWRGPNHDGLSSEKGFEKRFESAPPTIWKVDIGSGFSGMSCVGGRVYTCGTAGDAQVMFCLNAKDGSVIWKRPFEKGYRDGQGGDGTRATPAIDGKHVYIQGAWGRVVCFNTDTGEEVWRRDFESPPQWGYSASPLVEGDLLIVTGSSDGTLAALYKTTGKVVWQTGEGVIGYATPYPFTFNNRRYIVGFMGKEAFAVDAETGKQAWRMPWETSWDVNAATPIFDDGRLFLSSGYRHGSIVVKFEPRRGKLVGTTVWEDDSIRAKFQSPVLYKGYLYTSDEVGIKCVEFASGATKWAERGKTHGTVVVADDTLIVLTEEGHLLMGPATPKGWSPTTDVALMSGRHWTVPTLHDGRLYVRNLQHAACYDLKGK